MRNIHRKLNILKNENYFDPFSERHKKTIGELSKNVGGINNRIGELTEGLFSPELWEKFNKLGYPVTSQCCRKEFRLNKTLIAEADVYIENGEYAIPVEIKANLQAADIDGHIDRIQKIRQYLDAHGDKRKLIGAVAGATVTDKVRDYAHENGLFVITQNGDSTSIASTPKGFEPREW